MNYWLFKTEPTTWSIDDQQKDVEVEWEGIRNYQARNLLRDKVKVGDQVLFYHSVCKPPGIVGLVEVSKEAEPDFHAFDPKSDYYDPKSSPDNPRWFLVWVKFKKKFDRMLSLTEIKEHPVLQEMMVARKGSRLSIQPVEKEHFDLALEILNQG